MVSYFGGAVIFSIFPMFFKKLLIGCLLVIIILYLCKRLETNR